MPAAYTFIFYFNELYMIKKMRLFGKKIPKIRVIIFYHELFLCVFTFLEKANKTKMSGAIFLEENNFFFLIIFFYTNKILPIR